MTNHEKRVDELVDLLGCSIVEAEQIIADDEKINKNQAVDFDLSKEEEKKALKYANVKKHKKTTVYKFDKKEQKIDQDKKSIIDLLFEVVANQPKAKITNPHKTIMFMDEKGDIYTIDLGKATKKTYEKRLKELNGGE